MLDINKTLPSARTLAENCEVRIEGESADYRAARTALLVEEIELRRHIERVAAMRRALPPGAEVKNYRFVGEGGPTDLDGMFGDKQTLVVYTYMYGPQRARPCPMCTSLLSSWDGEALDIMQNVALAVTARSPIDRLVLFKKERGWRDLPLYSDPSGEFSRDFHAVDENGGDNAGLHVFTRRDGTLRHFWSGEMDGTTADPGQDPRGAPDLMPLWTVLDCTPEGRRPDWYPKLDYGR
ncbi:DUF899 family protein [Undibacter mobilis]|uniref:DUF899 domain-containing protein n=1 Tax=Undibacter mobilis TaxID=2292256 RepID=A0A371B9H9_9BRAD|nr:DUF899 family protein [Undibacter mobilis]RDV04157.1 DUF899 domain-containing protein [Undibacter mobilis]